MKEIKRIEETNRGSVFDVYDTLIITTDDDVRYVFDKVGHDVKFSHRYYPSEEGPEKWCKTNHQLPSCIIQYLHEEYDGYGKMEGMVKEAEKSKKGLERLRTA